MPAARHYIVPMGPTRRAHGRAVAYALTDMSGPVHTPRARSPEPAPPPPPRPDGLLRSKLQAPPPHPGEIERRGLVELLDDAEQSALVLVSAPPGYGKTTLLTQWASAAPRPIAWLTIDERDNDPAGVLAYLAAAVDQVCPLSEDLLTALSAPEASIQGSLLPGLLRGLEALESPATLILDEVHELSDPRCLDVIDGLITYGPAELQLVLAGQGQLTRRRGVLRAQGEVLEVGAEALSMDVEEAAALLESLGLKLPPADLSALVERTEGWPAGIALAGLAAKGAGGLESVAEIRGDNVVVSEYLRPALLARLRPDEITFLLRASVLERLSGPLCDAVLESDGSAGLLAELHQARVFLVPLDSHGEWYRFHGLVREALRAELERREPGSARKLLGRAADWSAEHGAPDVAVAYAQQAGDLEQTWQLVAASAQGEYQRGRAVTVEGWFDWLDRHGAMEEVPGAAAIGAWFSAIRGAADRAEQWTTLATKRSEGGGDPDPLEARLLPLLRAVRCEQGPEQMLAQAQAALELTPASDPWWPTATLVVGLALLVNDRLTEADDAFARVSEAGQERGGWNAASLGSAERAALAIADDDWVAAEAHVEAAQGFVRRSRMEEYPANALVYSVAARVALHRREPDRAAPLLAHAQRLRPRLTHAVTISAIQVRLELARAHVAAADPAGARTVMREVDALLRRGSGLGRLSADAAEVQGMIDSARTSAPGASTLTAAELKLLPLLATQRSFPEIGEQLYLSRYTIKSHAMAIYRKLDVTSRTAAVERARELGLL